MRRFLSLIAVMLSVFCLTFAVACGGNEGDKQPVCAHDYQSTGEVGYFEQDKTAFSKEKKCTICQQYIEVPNSKVVSANDCYDAIAGAKDNEFLFLKRSDYTGVTLYTTAKNLYLCFEKGSKVSRIMSTAGTIENITIDGLSFEGNFTMPEQVNGITIKNCKFTENAQISNQNDALIKDLSLIGCEFIGISSGGKLTAVRVNLCENLTVKDCIFNTIEYNALQIGGNRLTGTVIITGNTFKGTGSSVIHLANCHLTDCDISGNVFYLKDTLSGSNYLNILDNASGIVKFGVNTWEVIPEASEFYFEGISSGKVEYNMDEQLLLG
ncbi:MAG: hypothetical protein IJC07_03275 [Clostridia bacterium]|nr:hypothetical protein [Clostridia bacterium]